MEMWLRQSTVLFLAAVVAVAVMGTSGQTLVTLAEEQGRVHNLSGPVDLNLKCSLNVKDIQRFRVTWYFNPSECSFSEQHKRFTRMLNRSDNWEALMHYILPNAGENSSGWYFCKVTVEIPNLKSINSSGTKVMISKIAQRTTYPSLPIVTATESPKNSLDWWMWVLLGVSAFVLLGLLVLCVLLRKRCSRRREDPVYANTHPVAIKQPSPRPGKLVDHLKPASSSQNLRNQSPGRRYNEGQRGHKR